MRKVNAIQNSKSFKVAAFIEKSYIPKTREGKIEPFTHPPRKIPCT